MRTAIVAGLFFGILALTGHVEQDALHTEAELQVEHARTWTEADSIEAPEQFRYAVMVREDRECR